MKLFKIMIVLSMGMFATACAQQEEEVIMVAPDPVYDKYGNQIN